MWMPNAPQMTQRPRKPMGNGIRRVKKTDSVSKGEPIARNSG